MGLRCTPAAPDRQAVEALQEARVAARRGVADVADGIEIIDTGTTELQVKIDALRRLMAPVLRGRREIAILSSIDAGSLGAWTKTNPELLRNTRRFAT